MKAFLTWRLIIAAVGIAVGIRSGGPVYAEQMRYQWVKIKQVAYYEDRNVFMIYTNNDEEFKTDAFELGKDLVEKYLSAVRDQNMDALFQYTPPCNGSFTKGVVHAVYSAKGLLLIAMVSNGFEEWVQGYLVKAPQNPPGKY